MWGVGGAGLALSLGTLRRASLRRVRQAPVPLRRRRTPLPAPPHQRCSPFSPARVASPKRFSAQRRLGNPSVHIRGSDFPRSSFFLLPQAKIETCAGWAADAITCASVVVWPCVSMMVMRKEAWLWAVGGEQFGCCRPACDSGGNISPAVSFAPVRPAGACQVPR